MSKIKLTVSLILAALYNRMSWSHTSHDHAHLTYTQFLQIMMDEFEIIVDNGTCRQKWNDLIQCGYFIQSGKNAAGGELMKQDISTKIDEDLLEVVNEICSRRGITRSEFLINAIKHYITSSVVGSIPSLKRPDLETKVYVSTKEERFENQSQIHMEWGES